MAFFNVKTQFIELIEFTELYANSSVSFLRLIFLLSAFLLVINVPNAHSSGNHDHHHNTNNHDNTESNESQARTNYQDSNQGDSQDNNQDKKSYGSHIHGLSELMVAIDGSRLEIQFHSPAMNVIGFEHRAQTVQEKKRLAQLQKQLDRPEALFAIGTDKALTATASSSHSYPCRINKIKVDTDNLTPNDSPVHSSGHDHDHKKHTQDNHDHDSIDEQDDHHGHNHKSQSVNHSEISAHYVFNCPEDTAITSIRANVFEAFNGINRLYSVWVSGDQQGFEELNAKNNTLKFTQLSE